MTDAIWGIEATGSINVEMPIVLFAFLFGISMDYQVFILSRMREVFDRTGSTETAVVEGIGRTGRLVTSAALILGLAVVAMSTGPGTEAKMFATALGGGILLDATLIRGVLAPAVVALLGRWNWRLPSRAARVLRGRSRSRAGQGVGPEGTFGPRRAARPEASRRPRKQARWRRAPAPMPADTGRSTPRRSRPRTPRLPSKRDTASGLSHFGRDPGSCFSRRAP